MSWICRYNKKHACKSKEDRLNHESTCKKDNNINNLIECPYNRDHVMTKKQFESHYKNCQDYKKFIKSQKNNNYISNEDNNLDNGGENNINEKNNFKNDEINEDEIENEDINKDKENHFDFEKNVDPKKIFEKEDFIFKQCYE